MNAIIVTGGCGFIGSALIYYLLEKTDLLVVNIDKLTYAGNLTSMDRLSNDRRYVFKKIDINNREGVRSVLNEFKPVGVFHLAAESHVDRSINGPGEFIETNILGTYNLLEVIREYWVSLENRPKNMFRFHHVSTDEVYGSLGETGFFSEKSQYKPNSPYAASKASADHLVRAWHNTYGLPVVTTNCSNNYGPRQNTEKLIPLMINKAIGGGDLPIYGNGKNVRDWLYVDDHVEALHCVFKNGQAGEVFNIGGNHEMTNLQVVKVICELLDNMKPRSDRKSYINQLKYVADRPGHDFRYAIDSRKVQTEIGWKPSHTFSSGMKKTVEWYIRNLKASKLP